MLSERYNDASLREYLVFSPENRSFRLMPRCEERDVWSLLHEDVKLYYWQKGTKHAGKDWPSIPGIRYMDFRRNGNRLDYENICFERRRRLVDLVIAECIENQGTYMDDIITGIWLLCEESSWTVPGHCPTILPDISKPIIDLFSGETASVLGWTVYLLRNKLDNESPMIRERVKQEIATRVLNPYLQRDDFSWMGFHASKRLNNWSPWCTWNCLTAFLLIEEDVERRLQAVRKALKTLDIYLERFPDDGGCDEGASYWGHSVGTFFECLDLFHTISSGALNYFELDKIKAMGDFVAKMHIHKDYFVNFADGTARLDGSAHWAIPPATVFRFGNRIRNVHLRTIGSDIIRRRGVASLENQRVWSPFRIIPGLVMYRDMLNDTMPIESSEAAWFPVIEVMVAREKERTSKGFFLAAKGGNNGESHNHNDVGHFIVYYDGEPILIDVGVETYTAQTFGENRYDIWTMQSGYHSLPIMRGFQQLDGAVCQARHVDCSLTALASTLRMDLSPTYPTEAGVQSWVRQVSLMRGNNPFVEIRDDFRGNSNIECPHQLVFMTACEPQYWCEGFIRLGPKLWMEYDHESWLPRVELIAITDRERLQPVWGQCIYRILLVEKDIRDAGTCLVRVVLPFAAGTDRSDSSSA